MALYKYQKLGYQEPKADNPIPNTIEPASPISKNTRIHLHLIPTISSIIGMLLVASVVWPIYSYELVSSKNHKTKSGLLNPYLEKTEESNQPKLVGVDYTKASNWFPSTTNIISSSFEGPSSYTLTIDKLRIKDAVVSISSDDLSKHLVHYQETASPGALGSPVIFGHSILPQFYNPNNYMAIFSLLPTLDLGDEIKVDYDGIIYTYLVSEKTEVYPNDLWVLEQRYDAKRIKLITCVPPGLKTKRLVVTGVLKS